MVLSSRIIRIPLSGSRAHTTIVATRSVGHARVQRQACSEALAQVYELFIWRRRDPVPLVAMPLERLSRVFAGGG